MTIELFTHKQVRCEHCEFEFSFTGFASATKIVCPACGEENGVPPHSPPLAVTPESLPELSEDLPQVPVESPSLCSVEHCPLLTGHESGNTIAERLGLRHQKKQRRTVLAWTVVLQVCVLIGTALFVAQTRMLPRMLHKEEMKISPVAVNTETIPEKTPTELFPPLIVPSIVEGESKTAWNNTSVPGMSDTNTEYPLSPYEMMPEIHSHPQPSLVEPPIAACDDVKMPTPPSTQVEPVTLEMAYDLLESAISTLATDPENSIDQAIQAAKIYEQLGEPYHDSMYWILGNAFASLSWGESLLESSPAVETMTLSPDSRYLLAQLKDNSVWLWDLQELSHERRGFCLDSGAVNYVKFVFTPDLRWIIGGQKNGTIRIWDMSLKNPANTVITFKERILDLQDLQISPNGQWLAAYGHSVKGGLLAGNQQPNQSIQQVEYQQERNGVHDITYPVLLWNLRQMEIGVVPVAMLVPSTSQLPNQSPPVQAIQFSPNSHRLAVGRKDAVVSVYDVTAKGVSHDPFILRGHQLGVTQIAFAPNGQWMATGSQDNTVRLWNLATSKATPESATLYGHAGWISSLAIDASGEYIFSGSYDKTIRIWNIKRDYIGSALNREPIVLETGLGVPETLFVTQDGDKLIALGNVGSLGIYHLPSLLGDNPENNYRAVAFRNSRLSISRSLITPDDQLLIFSYEHLSNPSNSGIRLWPLQFQPFVQ